MAGEKYIVATLDNPSQINIRNILNPGGYIFLGNCFDPVSLLRLIRSYNPDFVVVDLGMQPRELRKTIETIDDEMLCACIALGDYRDIENENLVQRCKVLTLCQKPLSREIFLNTVELANMYYKRLSETEQKLKEMTENYETRKSVERAKWILIKRDGISEAEAYERMRKKSMDSRLTMKAIAEAIIFTHEIEGK
ncbi:MAG: ANTAR domain-containing protein [Bacillota bacterium]|nr:ANTAR domain-containing protein [Bacillota bacterium]